MVLPATSIAGFTCFRRVGSGFECIAQDRRKHATRATRFRRSINLTAESPTIWPPGSEPAIGEVPSKAVALWHSLTSRFQPDRRAPVKLRNHATIRRFGKMDQVRSQESGVILIVPRERQRNEE